MEQAAAMVTITLTWRSAGLGCPGGSCIPTGGAGHRCQADMPTPSWARWPGPAAGDWLPRGRNNASPTKDAGPLEST